MDEIVHTLTLFVCRHVARVIVQMGYQLIVFMKLFKGVKQLVRNPRSSTTSTSRGLILYTLAFCQLALHVWMIY